MNLKQTVHLGRLFHLKEGDNMDLFEAIEKRRSNGAVSMDPINKEDIKKILEAGNMAPNHFKIRPWEFVVLEGAALEKFADAHVEAFKNKFPEATAESLEKERGKGLRAPLVIAVNSIKPEIEKHNDIENMSAAAAACQNMLLAAESLGYASIWRTGMYIKDDHLMKFLNTDENKHLIGVLFIGKALPREADFPVRPTAEDRTNWY